MTEPTRLLASYERGDLAHAMLDAWRDERPSDAARTPTLVALGLKAPTTAPHGPPAPPSTWVALLMAKYVGVPVVLLLAAGFLASRLKHGTERVAVAKAAAAAGTALDAPAPSEVPAPSASAQTSFAPATSLERRPSRPSRAPLSRVSGAPPSSLANEIALVDAARAALARGDTEGARQLLDQYDAQYASGAFGQEAQVLRIEATATAGDRAQAATLTDEFIEAHPDSPYAWRLRKLTKE